jgi:hypothetical protein
MEKFHLYVEKEEDLEFNGIKLAEVESEYNNEKTIWQLYETESRRLVCYESFTDINDNINIKYQICETHEEVKEYFGLCKTAKEIYKQANINCALQVDELDLNSLKSQSQQNETSCNLEDEVYL